MGIFAHRGVVWSLDDRATAKIKIYVLVPVGEGARNDKLKVKICRKTRSKTLRHKTIRKLKPIRRRYENSLGIVGQKFYNFTIYIHLSKIKFSWPRSHTFCLEVLKMTISYPKSQFSGLWKDNHEKPIHWKLIIDFLI